MQSRKRNEGVNRITPLDRYYILDEALSKFAREYLEIKFLRSRAAALRFASALAAAPTSGRRVGKFIFTGDDGGIATQMILIKTV